MRPSSSAIGTKTPGETIGAIGPAPAGERFGADEFAGFELHLGLEDGDELAAFEAFAHFDFELRLGPGLVQQALVEEGASDASADAWLP